MKRKISFLLCVVMLVSLLAGCGNDNLSGAWEATIDVSGTIGADLANEITANTPELKEYLDLSGLTLVVKTVFNEDGTYSSTITEESFNEMMNVIAAKSASGLVAYANKLIEELKLDVDVNGIFGLQEGETLENKMKETFKAEDFKKIIESNTQSGAYKVQGGKIFTADTVDGFSDEKYESYKLNGDILEITEAVGLSEEAQTIISKSYPITYNKIAQ